MRILILSLFVLLFACKPKSGKPPKEAIEAGDCQKYWKILEPKKRIVGIVIFHAKTNVGCGVLATGSVTIIKTKDGDTYRVIELCNTDKDFLPDSTVYVDPNEKMAIPLIPSDPQQCRLMETFFGVLQKAK